MRIESVDVYTVALPFERPERFAAGARWGCSNVVVKLTTDDGLVGWGEASGGSGGSVTVTRAAVDACIPIVLGMNPFEVEALRSRVFTLGRWRNLHRLAHLALAGYEIAFFDLMGKACGRPVSDLLGGAIRDRVSFYGYVVTDEPGTMAADAAALVADGFHTLYVKGAWDTHRDQEVLTAIREAVGPSPQIRVDGNEALAPSEAITWIRALEPFDLEFVEQPTPAVDLEGMRRVRDASPIPVAANQGLWSSEEIMQVIRARAADIIVTGPLWVGGLLGLKKAAAIAAAAGMPFCRHAPPEGGIATAAGLHVLATLPQLMDGNQIYLGPILHQDIVVGSPPDFESGCLPVPEGPGLGIDIDEMELKRLASIYESQGDFAQWSEQLLEQRARFGTDISP